MNVLIWGSFLFLTASLAAPASYAESIRGSIVSIDQSNQTVTIDPEEASPLGGREAGGGNVVFRLGQDTQFSQGVNSLQDLEVGDQLNLEATRQIGGDWQVQSLATTSTTENAATGSLDANAEAMRSDGRPLTQQDINAGALGTNNAPSGTSSLPGGQNDPNRPRNPTVQDLNAGARTTNNFSAGASAGLANRDTSLSATATGSSESNANAGAGSASTTGSAGGGSGNSGSAA